jgi:hypothetical protein
LASGQKVLLNPEVVRVGGRQIGFGGYCAHGYKGSLTVFMRKNISVRMATRG